MVLWLWVPRKLTVVPWEGPSSREGEINEAYKQGTSDNQMDVIIALVDLERYNPTMSETLKTVNADRWATLTAKAEGEAEEELESCTEGESP